MSESDSPSKQQAENLPASPDTAAENAAEDPIFVTPDGAYRGWRDGAVQRATGIRYATTKRGKAPVAVEPHDGVIDALDFSPACPQLLDEHSVFGDGPKALPQDEDCTRLSITAPAGTSAGDDLPVMVWIHGGAHVSGAGDQPNYDAAALAAEQRVVVVSITYRIGMLGFLGDGRSVPANLGLLDLIEALRWIKRNIRAFGGSPETVTLFGQSAGADAILCLMIAEGAKGLFQRAIAQSPPLGLRFGRSRMTAAMAVAVGDTQQFDSVADILELQNEAEKAAARYIPLSGMPFGPEFGMPPLPPERAVRRAHENAAPRIDLLIGQTAEEGMLYTLSDPRLVAARRIPVIGRMLHALETRIVTDHIWTRPLRRFAKRYALAGGRVRRYTINWRPRGSRLRTAHGSDCALVFPSGTAWAGTDIMGRESADSIERAGRGIRALWAEFAREGTLPEGARIPGVFHLDKL